MRQEIQPSVRRRARLARVSGVSTHLHGGGNAVVGVDRPIWRLLHHHGVGHGVLHCILLRKYLKDLEDKHEHTLWALMVVWMRVRRNWRGGHRRPGAGAIGRRICSGWWRRHVCLRGCGKKIN
jgi:hypothetical protein